MKNICAICALLLTLLSCRDKTPLTAEQETAYENEINAWHARRIEKLKEPNGWLNIIGLHWLEPGMNSFGSDEKNKIVFPKNKIAGSAGYFLVNNGKVEIFVNKEAVVTSGKDTIERSLIFQPDSVSLTLQSGTLRWNIIKREDRLGIRLRDDDNDAHQAFTGIERYPVDDRYRLVARFIKADSSRVIDIANIIGQTTLQKSPGSLSFELEGQEFRLDVLEGGKDEFFLIFADETSGDETYQGGRFLYVSYPNATGEVVLDFNKAINPPCVLTPYATCPLPPPQNVLPVAIKAGEKNYHH